MKPATSYAPRPKLVSMTIFGSGYVKSPKLVKPNPGPYLEKNNSRISTYTPNRLATNDFPFAAPNSWLASSEKFAKDRILSMALTFSIIRRAKYLGKFCSLGKTSDTFTHEAG